MKLRTRIFHDGPDSRDMWVYIAPPSGDEWRFMFYIDKTDRVVREGDCDYAEDLQACFDGTDKIVPDDVDAFLQSNMTDIRKELLA